MVSNATAPGARRCGYDHGPVRTASVKGTLSEMIVKVRWSYAQATKSLWRGTTLNTTGAENLLATGAKLYYLGGGWWRICGYAYDGKDVKPYL